MLTGRQMRQPRSLLRWRRETLSVKASLTINLFVAVESSEGRAWLSDEQEATIRRACEDAVVRFEVDDEGQPAAVMTGAMT